MVSEHEMVERLIRACQKYRSNVDETLGDMDGLAGELQPWTAGGKLMPLLLQLSEQEKIAPLDMFNVLTIAHHLAPEVLLAYSMFADGDQLPEPAVYLQTALEQERSNAK